MSVPTDPPRTADALRRWVRERSPQPFDEADVVPPAAGRLWAYGPGQYELALLDRLVDDGFAANRHVHYPRNHGRLDAAVSFAATASAAAVVRVEVRGEVVSASVDGRPVGPPSRDGALELALPGAGSVVAIEVRGGGDGPPLLTLDPGAPLTGWRGSGSSGAWEEIRLREGAQRAPHLDPVGTVVVWATRTADGVYDLGAPVLGRPVLPAGPRPEICTGESLEEALADPADHETRHDLVALPDGGWTSTHLLGFRYLVVRSGPTPDRIEVTASVPPADRPGAFACSDEQLTRIWAAAQYTLRLCAQGLMIDGIKRDRMPWAGDQALSTLANAYALGDGAIVADGLVALGRPGSGYVNGIADYSLWWVVNSELRLRHFGDEGFAHREADRLHAFVDDLASHAGQDGIFRPASQRDGFPNAGPGSVFLDWGVVLEHGRDPVALQMLWYWALRSAARTLDAAGHPGAERWSVLADRVAAALRERAWLPDAGRWADYLDARRSEAPARYANFLAVLASMHEGDTVPPGVTAALHGADIGTPFMTAFRLRALAEAGDREGAVSEIRHLWGPMLDRGPGTFWEEVTTDDDTLAMYGRPFGRSLCHAWAAGPAVVLPEAVLGLRPLGDGWSRFEIDPHLGDLEWACAVVPTASGDIVVQADADGVRVDIPAGSGLVDRGSELAGPARVEWRALSASTRTAR